MFFSAEIHSLCIFFTRDRHFSLTDGLKTRLEMLARKKQIKVYWLIIFEVVSTISNTAALTADSPIHESNNHLPLDQRRERWWMELSWTCLIERGGIRKMIWSAVEKRRKKKFSLFRFVWLRSSRFCKVKSSLRRAWPCSIIFFYIDSIDSSQLRWCSNWIGFMDSAPHSTHIYFSLMLRVLRCLIYSLRCIVLSLN